MSSEVTVGLVGFGTVGSGVTKVLLQNSEIIARRVGKPVILKRIVDLDLETDRGIRLRDGMLTSDLNSVLEDPSIDIVIELIGGYDVAKKLMLSAMQKGKHIVTANKALLAVHGEDIFEAANQAGVDIQFEASVGGGIPIIRSLTEGLAANHLSSIVGILNGTSNYILSRMIHEKESFDKALEQAKIAGYAEADPTFDVEGIDSAHKLAIMVNLAYGTPVNIKEVYTEGITKLTSLDIAYALEFGMTIKLLGIAKFFQGEVEIRVHPTMISQNSSLGKVDGVYNAIQLVGDAVGNVVLFGQGAGSLPTASAVVSDVIDIARNLKFRAFSRVPPTSFPLQQRSPLSIRPMENLTTRYYLRFMVLDKPGVLSKISGVLGSQGISIASVIQKGRQEGQTVPVVIMTHRATERSVRHALHEIEKMSLYVTEPTVFIRVEEEQEQS